MMRWVRIEDVGDTEFVIDEQTDKFRFAKKKTLWRTSRFLRDRPCFLYVVSGFSRCRLRGSEFRLTTNQR